MGRFLTFVLLAHTAVAQVKDKLKYVDQLIGTDAGGNVFAAATLPYGMAKAGPDTNSDSRQGGFTSDGANITGFSSMHDSGTGGQPSLGLFPLFPYASCKNDTIDGCALPKISRATPYVNDSVKASPGYFSLNLQSGIQGESTAALHTSLFRFTFPEGGSPAVILDLTDLQDSRQDNASISVDDKKGRMTGGAVFLPSFGQGNYTAYFCADFKGSNIKEGGIYVNSRGSADVKELKISRGINGYPLPGGGFLRFTDASPVLARVGLSFISSEQACQLAEDEIPDFDFQKTKSTATAIWKEKMSPIDVSTKGVNDSLLTNFYSGIYRTMINPQNYTGVVPVVSADTIYFDSFYCIWDLFRSTLPFITIFDTPALVDMIQGLLTLYKVQGWLPDCHMSLDRGYTQGGSNADVVMADAYVKLNRTAKIDWDLVYEAVQKDAEEEPYDWCCQGRGGLDSWKRLGYIPAQDFDYKGFGTMTRSISRTLEYSYNDFCIAEIARGQGHQGDAEKYEKSSENWANLFKADQTSNLINSTTSTGFTGFFQPKFLNHTWGFQDPLRCSNIGDPSDACSLQTTGGETFESSIWEYSFYVPQDQARLISAFGGPNTFVKRLDYMHDKNITYIGNEPAFLTVVQYHYAGRPALSAERAHFYVPRYFSPTNGGLAGNDDSGTMGAFLAFTMMGLSPVPGQDVYLITPPFFESVNITSPVSGKVATIRNEGFDASYEAIYIQRATLDGKPYTKNWIDNSFFLEGRELVLTLGKNESAWGRKVEDLPPSLSEYQF